MCFLMFLVHVDLICNVCSWIGSKMVKKERRRDASKGYEVANFLAKKNPLAAMRHCNSDQFNQFAQSILPLWGPLSLLSLSLYLQDLNCSTMPLRKQRMAHKFATLSIRGFAYFSTKALDILRHRLSLLSCHFVPFFGHATNHCAFFLFPGPANSLTLIDSHRFVLGLCACRQSYTGRMPELSFLLGPFTNHCMASVLTWRKSFDRILQDF